MSKVAHHAHHKIADKPKQETRKKGRDAALLILVAAFLTGAAVGCILAGKLAPNNVENLLRQALSSQTRPALWRELWAVFRWPMAALILGCLPMAWLTLPGVFFLRGMFLGYVVQIVARGVASHGFLWAGVLFGPTCLLAVPIFFVIGYLGLLRAAAQTPGRAQLLLGSAVCCGPLALCIFLDRTVVLNLLDILLASLVSA